MTSSDSTAPNTRENPLALVTLRPIGTALPLGFATLSLGMILLGAQGIGWIPAAEQQTLGILIAAYVFPLGLVASVFGFLARDGLGGTTLGLLATSWLAIGLVYITSEPGSTSIVGGLFRLGFALIVVVVSVVAARGKPLIAAVLALTAVRSFLEGLHQLTDNASLATAGGVVAFVAAGVGIYTALALLIEHSWPPPGIPLFRRAHSADAVTAGSLPSSTSLSDQPGVRGEL